MLARLEGDGPLSETELIQTFRLIPYCNRPISSDIVSLLVSFADNESRGLRTEAFTVLHTLMP